MTHLHELLSILSHTQQLKCTENTHCGKRQVTHTHRMRTYRELPPSLHGWLLKYWATAVPIASSLRPGYNRRPSTAIQPCSQCRTECTSLIAGQGKTQRHSTINPQLKHGTQLKQYIVLEAVQGDVQFNSLGAIHTRLMNAQYLAVIVMSPVLLYTNTEVHTITNTKLHPTLTGSTHA